MKIYIKFKNGFLLPITCTGYAFKISPITGKLIDYKNDGAKDNKPIFLNIEDIECVWEDMEQICEK